jgi:hypothetical protein
LKVAFNFVINASLPKVGYLTAMDKYITTSYSFAA